MALRSAALICRPARAFSTSTITFSLTRQARLESLLPFITCPLLPTLIEMLSKLLVVVVAVLSMSLQAVAELAVHRHVVRAAAPCFLTGKTALPAEVAAGLPGLVNVTCNKSVSVPLTTTSDHSLT